MIISSIRMKGQSGKRKEILQTMNGILARVRRRKGCLDAATYQDVNDKNIFYLVEQWRTRHDMDAYLHSNLFAVLLGVETILSEKPEIKILHEDGSCRCGNKQNARIRSTMNNH